MEQNQVNLNNNLQTIQILNQSKIKSVNSVILTKNSIQKDGIQVNQFPIILKPIKSNYQLNNQVNNDNQGIIIKDYKQLITQISIQLKENMEQFLISEPINYEKKFFISIQKIDEILIEISLSDKPEKSIKQIEQNNPNSIRKIQIKYFNPIQTNDIIGLTHDYELNEIQFKNFKNFIINLLQCYNENELKYIEINPLILTQNNEFISLNSSSQF